MTDDEIRRVLRNGHTILNLIKTVENVKCTFIIYRGFHRLLHVYRIWYSEPCLAMKARIRMSSISC